MNAQSVNEKLLNCYLSDKQKVYVHTDRNMYVVGDEIYFKAYVFQSIDNKLDTLTKVVYMELRNSKNQRVLSLRSNILNGVTAGKFSIPDSLTSGYYKLRAFTNNMRNADHSRYFSKNIVVVNLSDEKLETLPYSIQNSSKKDSSNELSTNFIKVVEQQNGNLEISIEADSSMLTDKPRIVCYQNCKIIYTTAEIKQRASSFVISNDLFDGGLLNIALLDNKNNTISEKAFYSRKSLNIVKVQYNNNIYKCRDKVDVSIELEKTYPNLKFSTVSVSVAQKDNYFTNSNYLLNSYLQYYSNFNNAQFQSTYRVGDSTDAYLEPNSSQCLLNLASINNSKRNCFALPENKGFILSGKVVNQAKEPVANTSVFLSATDTFATLKYCITNANGIFYFRLNKSFDNKDLILQVIDSYRKDLHIELEDKYNNEISLETNQTELSDFDKNFLETARLVTLVNKVTDTAKIGASVKLDSISSVKYNFYGLPDAIVYPLEYDLSNFEEIINNIVPGVWCKQVGSSCLVRVINKGTKTLWPFGALILLNNIPFPDLNYIAQLSSKQIKSIEIKKNHLVFWSTQLLWCSVNKNSTKQQICIRTGKMQVQSIQINVTMSLYNEINKAVNNNLNAPDLRKTLYWNPGI